MEIVAQTCAGWRLGGVVEDLRLGPILQFRLERYFRGTLHTQEVILPPWLEVVTESRFSSPPTRLHSLANWRGLVVLKRKKPSERSPSLMRMMVSWSLMRGDVHHLPGVCQRSARGRKQALTP